MGSKRFARIDCLTQEINVLENGHSHNILVERNNTIRTELEHFVKCIRNNHVANNKYPNHNSGLLGANVVRLIEVARMSLKNERTESVEFW
jgi:hypothetical protein